VFCVKLGFADKLNAGIGKTFKCAGKAIPLEPLPFHAQL
jgi:hypothetical protein